VGSALDDSSWLSRFSDESDAMRSFAEMAALGVTLLLAVMSFRRKSALLGYVAALVGAVVPFRGTSVRIRGLPNPIWDLAKTTRQGLWLYPARVHGAERAGALLAHPIAPSMPPGPQSDATAIARQVRIVNHIWGNQPGMG